MAADHSNPVASEGEGGKERKKGGRECIKEKTLPRFPCLLISISFSGRKEGRGDGKKEEMKGKKERKKGRKKGGSA